MDERSEHRTVALVRYDGTFASFERSLELCEGLRGLRPADKVLLKPNLMWGGTRSDPQFGRVTTSTVVGHTLEALREWGCTDLTVGDGSVPSKEFRSTTWRAFQWSGIDKVARRYGAKLVDFNAGPHEAVQLEDTTIELSTWALESDFLIDLPVLKTHQQAKVSLGMKNLKGVLSFGSKQKFHRHGLDRLIALLNTKIHPALTIIDGIYGLERGPEFSGTAHRRDLIIAGKDVLSCDIVGASVMGIPSSEVGHLNVFASLTGRSLALDDVDLRGVAIEDVRQHFEWRLPIEDAFHRAGIAGITVQPLDDSICTGCAVFTSALVGVVTKDCRGTQFDGVEVCVGRKMKAHPDSKTVFLIGSCAVAANKDVTGAVRIGGCPPSATEALRSFYLKSLPRRKAAAVLASRTIRSAATALGVYSETFAAFGVHEPPAFDKNHF